MEKITYYTNSGEFEAEKLLPCPFCGGKPEFITIGNEATKNRKAQIECTKCHVRRTTGAIRNSLEWCGRKAIEHWNARWQEISHESAALPLHGVSASLLSDKDYWKIRCQLSEAIEAKNPCDPDITSGQIKAYEDYHKFISHYGNAR